MQILQTTCFIVYLEVVPGGMPAPTPSDGNSAVSVCSSGSPESSLESPVAGCLSDETTQESVISNNIYLQMLSSTRWLFKRFNKCSEIMANLKVNIKYSVWHQTKITVTSVDYIICNCHFNSLDTHYRILFCIGSQLPLFLARYSP